MTSARPCPLVQKPISQFCHTEDTKKLKKVHLLSVQPAVKYEIILSSRTKEDISMRGFFTAGGFYGMVNGVYLLFSSESEYYDYLREEDD
jgi:hypothetical protein